MWNPFGRTNTTSTSPPNRDRVDPLTMAMAMPNPRLTGDRLRKPEEKKEIAAQGIEGLTDAQIEEEKMKAEMDLRRRMAGQGRAANILAGANPNLMEAPSARRTLLGGQ